MALGARAEPSPGAPFSTREVDFAGPGVSLAGSLLVPSGEGPFPGVVIVHGSGTSARSNPWTSAWAEALVLRGVAVLYPDKRGAGRSAGDWREADFTALADDALAALDVLGAEPRVDPERVGLIGFSQGGHVVPLAATRSPAVKFVVDVSGSVVPMYEQIGDEIRLAGAAEGLGDAPLRELDRIHRLGCAFARTGEGWASYRQALDRAAEGALQGTEAIAEFPTDRESPAWGFLRTIGNFDPLPCWREVRVPAAFLFGQRDSHVDVAKSVRIVEETLMTDGRSVSLLVFAGNGHAHFRADALDFLARWIRDGGVD